MVEDIHQTNFHSLCVLDDLWKVCMSLSSGLRQFIVDMFEVTMQSVCSAQIDVQWNLANIQTPLGLKYLS